MPMKKVLEKLPAEKFKSIHCSYIVSVAKVKAIQNRKVHLAAGVELPSAIVRLTSSTSARKIDIKGHFPNTFGDFVITLLPIHTGPNFRS
jgi:hypothetical protein